ncbi:MAG: DNA polymerase I [Pseudomonadota bacterium]
MSASKTSAASTKAAKPKENRCSVPSGEPVPVIKGSHIYLVDGSGYIFRAFHALPPLTRPSDGLPVGAVHGFCQMLWKLLGDSKLADRPTHFAVIFDYSKDSFRNEIYDAYKANRPPPPEELVPQFPLIRDAVKAFNLACIEQEGYEADDLIATYATEAAAADAEVTIVSSDKDLMQLVAPGVTMFDGMKNNFLGADEVRTKFGVTPDKVVDVQALAGDSVDNVPGVPGIGVKTAAELINTYGDLDALLARAEEIKQPKRRERLIEFADQARLSRELVRLKSDVPVDFELPAFGVQDPEPTTLLGFLRAMEFNTLTKRISESLGVEPPEPLDVSVGSSVAAGSAAKKKATAEETSHDKADGGVGTPAAGASAAMEAAKAVPIDRASYETVTTLEQLQQWIADARERRYFAFDTETTSLDAMQADLVGLSIATAPGRACYVPLAHTTSDGGLDLAGGEPLTQIGLREALDALKPVLEDPAILKIGQNLKYDILVLTRYGVRLRPFDDTLLLSYAGEGGRRSHGMDDLALSHLGHTCISFKSVIAHAPGKKAADKSFAQVPIDKATEYAAEDADVTLRLWMILKSRLIADRLTTVYETLERPLVDVIVDMEAAGVKVDKAILSRLSGTFAQRAAQLEDEVYDLAGQKFNLGSPKQLGELLFDKLGLPGGKKTKTGQWETRANLLDDLSNNPDLPDDARKLVLTMLEWRQLTKLRSTYTDALPGHVHPDTGRIHTSYALGATTTGRLASTDPNLQNIPIRTKEGREIRTAFISEKGHKLISADYSQIELRVLAHIANIPQLRQAFDDGLDIHAMTASEMFGVPIDGMPAEVRRRAKAINFGIIYGISAFGLANQLAISREEASAYIKTYFQRFPGIRDYMENTKTFARTNGYVETVFGRRVHYPEINTKNPSARGFYERAAINAPIQGTAADIIRRAMIRMPRALADAGLDRTRMLLQVHDELIFEAPTKDVDKTIDVVRKVMIRAPEPTRSLAVPLQVDANAADNWEEAH